MRFLGNVLSATTLLWLTVFALGLVITPVIVRSLESEETKASRSELKKQEELRKLAERILRYGHDVHEQFPTGDVVVSQRDLAEQLRKRTEVVVTALNLLLNEQKVQRAPLSGYWKLKGEIES